MTTIIVPGQPIAQPRQRHTKAGWNYTPAEHPANAFKAAIRIAWQRANVPLEPADIPIRLEVGFCLARPQAKPAKFSLAHWRLCHCHHISRPDLDNMLKAVKDALSGLAWRDDSQVCQVYASKEYAADGSSPCAKIGVFRCQWGE